MRIGSHSRTEDAKEPCIACATNPDVLGRAPALKYPFLVPFHFPYRVNMYGPIAFLCGNRPTSLTASNIQYDSARCLSSILEPVDHRTSNHITALVIEHQQHSYCATLFMYLVFHTEQVDH